MVLFNIIQLALRGFESVTPEDGYFCLWSAEEEPQMVLGVLIPRR